MNKENWYKHHNRGIAKKYAPWNYKNIKNNTGYVDLRRTLRP